MLGFSGGEAGFTTGVGTFEDEFGSSVFEFEKKSSQERALSWLGERGFKEVKVEEEASLGIKTECADGGGEGVVDGAVPGAPVAELFSFWLLLIELFGLCLERNREMAGLEYGSICGHKS